MNIFNIYADVDARSMTASRNTRSSTLRSVPSTSGRSFFQKGFFWDLPKANGKSGFDMVGARNNLEFQRKIGIKSHLKRNISIKGVNWISGAVKKCHIKEPDNVRFRSRENTITATCHMLG